MSDSDSESGSTTSVEDNELDQNDETATSFELIRRVECRSFIYNCRDPQHSKRDAINNAWKEISKGLRVNGKKATRKWCKNKWKTLRDYYRNVKRSRKGKSGDAAKTKKLWKYYSEMDRILSAFMDENENTQSNYTGDDSDDEIPATDSRPATPVDQGNSEETTPTGPPKPSKTRKRKYDDSERLLNETIAKLCEEPEEIKDQFYHYSMTICNRLRSMAPQTAEYAMLRMSSLLYEITYTTPFQETSQSSNQHIPSESTPRGHQET